MHGLFLIFVIAGDSAVETYPGGQGLVPVWQSSTNSIKLTGVFKGHREGVCLNMMERRPMHDPLQI